MTFENRLYAHLAQEYQFDITKRSQIGISLHENAPHIEQNSCSIWSIDQHRYLCFNSSEAHYLHGLQNPTLETLRAKYAEKIEYSFLDLYYVLDPDRFTPFVPAKPYTVRQLHAPDDQAIFDAFLANCSEEDRFMADVSTDPTIGVAWGVLQGQRLVACASTYEFQGFIDVGILTDPDFRNQGLGKAAVSGLSESFLKSDRLLLYRHDAENVASQKIAQGLNYWNFARIEFIKFKSPTANQS